VVEHRVEYLAPARFDGQEIDVDLWVGAVGAAQFWLGYDVRQGEATVARARTQLANFDFVAGRPARLAPAERAWFAGRSTDVEEFPSLGEYAVGEAFHEHPIAVRWSDLDSYGHVNNVRFFDYVAEARIAMRESLLQGSITGLGTGDSEHTWMVARQDLRYRGQVRHRLAPYAVRTAIGRVGRTSLTLVADLVDPGDDAVLATRHLDPRPRRRPWRPLPAARPDRGGRAGLGGSWAAGVSLMWRCAVAGQPIAHSLSPLIHTTAYRVLGIEDSWEYDRVELDAAGLPGFVAGCGPEWVGLSCTAPLKHAVLGLGTASPRALLLDSGNTLVFAREGRPARVENTDVTGMLGALARGGGHRRRARHFSWATARRRDRRSPPSLIWASHGCASWCGRGRTRRPASRVSPTGSASSWTTVRGVSRGQVGRPTC
jgi:acyl-CoA thioester hydrolase